MFYSQNNLKNRFLYSENLHAEDNIKLKRNQRGWKRVGRQRGLILYYFPEARHASVRGDFEVLSRRLYCILPPLDLG